MSLNWNVVNVASFCEDIDHKEMHYNFYWGCNVSEGHAWTHGMIIIDSEFTIAPIL